MAPPARILRSLWATLKVIASSRTAGRWVKVTDRVMPFVVNLATQGQNWKDQSIRKPQVLKINEPVQDHASQIYAWMEERIENCVKAGWLIDG